MLRAPPWSACQLYLIASREIEKTTPNKEPLKRLKGAIADMVLAGLGWQHWKTTSQLAYLGVIALDEAASGWSHHSMRCVHHSEQSSSQTLPCGLDSHGSSLLYCPIVHMSTLAAQTTLCLKIMYCQCLWTLSAAVLKVCTQVPSPSAGH